MELKQCRAEKKECSNRVFSSLLLGPNESFSCCELVFLFLQHCSAGQQPNPSRTLCVPCTPAPLSAEDTRPCQPCPAGKYISQGSSVFIKTWDWGRLWWHFALLTLPSLSGTERLLVLWWNWGLKLIPETKQLQKGREHQGAQLVSEHQGAHLDLRVHGRGAADAAPGWEPECANCWAAREAFGFSSHTESRALTLWLLTDHL